MIEDIVRRAMHDIADDIPEGDGLTATALHRARRRRTARITATSGVAVATIASAGLFWLNHDGLPIDVSNEPVPAAPPAAADFLPPAASREMTNAELAAAFEECRGAFAESYSDWTPTFGIVLEADFPDAMATRWVASRRGDEYRADCALDSDGNAVGGGGEYGLKSTPGLLYAVVDGQEGAGVGRYAGPVAQVTVQREDGPEQAAVIHDGFWFFPETRTAVSDHQDELDPAGLPDDGLIGVERGYTYRGYDTDGQLVYDSSADGPSVEECYADPTGAEVVGGSAENQDPAECVQMIVWQPPTSG